MMIMLNTVMILSINGNYKYDVVVTGGKMVRYFIFQFDNLLLLCWLLIVILSFSPPGLLSIRASVMIGEQKQRKV